MIPSAVVRFLVLLLAFAAVPSARAQPAVRVSAGGKLHVDARAFPEGPLGDTPGFLVRRARAEVEVSVGDRLRVVGEVDLGEGEAELVDGYVEVALGRGLVARAGRFKTPFGYESLLSSRDLRFAERSLATALSPRRDLGASVRGTWRHVDAEVGVFNGVGDGASAQTASDGALDAVGRVFVRPAGTGLGLGVAASAGTEHGDSTRSALAAYETPGDRTIYASAASVVADGPRLRVGPQATFDAGPLHLLGEWTWARHRVAGPAGRTDLTHRAWQAAASFVVVGEPRGSRRPVPRRSVWDGGPGAVEVSARVHRLVLDPDAALVAAPGRARRATAWGAAVHWSPVAEARLGVTAERTTLSGFAGGPPETFIVVRAQIDF